MEINANNSINPRRRFTKWRSFWVAAV